MLCVYIIVCFVVSVEIHLFMDKMSLFLAILANEIPNHNHANMQLS